MCYKVKACAHFWSFNTRGHFGLTAWLRTHTGRDPQTELNLGTGLAGIKGLGRCVHSNCFTKALTNSTSCCSERTWRPRCSMALTSTCSSDKASSTFSTEAGGSLRVHCIRGHHSHRLHRNGRNGSGNFSFNLVELQQVFHLWSFWRGVLGAGVGGARRHPNHSITDGSLGSLGFGSHTAPGRQA